MNNNKDVEYVKELAKQRLAALPPGVSFSIGSFGEFTRDELIKEIDNYSEVGREAIAMQIEVIKRMPKILEKAQ